mgnify:FL=1|tara:strand:- start:4822 stop:7023 length:2202 start_codon:yes stop_codon:yes gene_type:complete
MAYILKNTAGLLSTVLTDAGRRAMSRGLFNISYFQVGDSEVCYDCIENANLSTLNVLAPEYNAQNKTSIPEKNKMHVKYPLFVDSTSGSTWGIPFSNPIVDDIYNTAAPIGFFTGNSGSFSAFTTSAYTKSSNFVVDLSTMNSGDTFTGTYSLCDSSSTGDTQVGDFVSIWMDGIGNCGSWSGSFPMLMYRVKSITGSTTGNTSIQVQVDRKLPDFTSMGFTGNARVYFFPSSMTEIYDENLPLSYDEIEALNFDTNCILGSTEVKVWNMNIPWTESPAGFTVNDKGFSYFGSTGYTGSKEYFGYNSDSGQVDTDPTYYYNSLSEKISLSPSDQKAVAVIHYTNQSLDNYYGDKFAQQPFDSANSGATGQARNFRIDIPWLMWHKNSSGVMGESFYTDPSGFDGKNLFQVHYMESIPNSNMDDPGLRYYNLWDTHANTNGIPNRVGKVYPDLKTIVMDDDELVASLNYKSNRNWTLPAPKLGLITPNSLGDVVCSPTGLLSGTSENLWVTYRFNSTNFTDSLHCNYYSKISGKDASCDDGSFNVTMRFGNEFPFLNSLPSGSPSGFSANEFMVLAQKTNGTDRPDPALWIEVTGITEQLSSTNVGGYVTVSGLTETTLQITSDGYSGGTYYSLENYIDLPQTGDTQMNFGDEFFFYGSIKSDIQATIYVMNYQVNLGQAQFMDSTNPTWGNTYSPYVTEVGLYDSNKDLMIITKVQAPEKRQGVQQYSIKLDF